MLLVQVTLTQALEVGPVGPKVAKYVAFIPLSYTSHLDTAVIYLFIWVIKLFLELISRFPAVSTKCCIWSEAGGQHLSCLKIIFKMRNAKFKWDDPSGAVQPGNIYFICPPLFFIALSKGKVFWCVQEPFCCWTKSVWEIANQSQERQEIKADHFQMNA